MPYIILDPRVAAWAPFPWAWVCTGNGHPEITILDGNIEDCVEVDETTSPPENSCQKPVNGYDKTRMYAVMSRLIERAKK